MQIDLNKEEMEFIIRFCIRAKMMADLNLTKKDDLEKVSSLLDKLKRTIENGMDQR